jgi:hypothetical protein
MGKTPFENSSTTQLFKKILNEEPNYAGISSDLTYLLVNILKKNPNERFTLLKIKTCHCLQEITYQKLMTETIKSIMAKDEQDFVEHELIENLSEENRSVAIHILLKQKINVLIECLNHVNLDILDSFRDDEIQKSSGQNIEGKKQVRIPRRNSNPVFKNHESNPLTPQEDQKTENSKPLLSRKRRVSIQQHIINAQHVPLCKSAFTIPPTFSVLK